MNSGRRPTGDQDGRIRVLVVDNDGRVRNAIAQTIALESDMVLVAEAPDAQIAVTMAEQTRPAVALVDVLLPDDHAGLALVDTLRRSSGCAVVAMSVRSGLRLPALAAGAVAFVEKDSDIDAVLDAIRTATTRGLS